MAMEKPRGSVRFDGPNVDVLVDLGHPLLNRVVDGFIKVDGIGALNAASQDAYKLVVQEEANKASFENMSNSLARSPQSTLSAVGSWSRGSSKGPSQVSSPPTTPLTENTDAWDLLYAAADEVVRLEMDGANPISTSPMHAQGFQGHVRRQNFSASQSPAFLNKDLAGKSCSFSALSSKDRINSSQILQRTNYTLNLQRHAHSKIFQGR